MYITVHAAAGGAIGQFISEPWLAFALGFISHFILDAIPHGDENLKKLGWFKTLMKQHVGFGLIDFAGVLLTSILWINTSDLNQLTGVLAGIAGAIAPDALWGFHEFTKSPLLNSYRKFHNNLHHVFKKKITLMQGFALQIPLLILFSWILARF
jgi:hypothetical protein